MHRREDPAADAGAASVAGNAPSWSALLADPPRRILWGVAPTGDVHLGYLPYFLLLNRLREMGVEPVVLIANYHAYLDAGKTRWGDLDTRTAAYRRVFETGGLEVVETRSFYLEPAYLEQLFALALDLPLAASLQAGLGTLANPEGRHTVADALYVATQVLDVSYLAADAVLCGEDEARIYRFGLPVLEGRSGVRCRACYLPMCPGVLGPEMHASDRPDNKIILSDPPERIRERMRSHQQVHPGPAGSLPLVRHLEREVFPLAGGEAMESGWTDGDSRSIDPVAERLAALLAPWRDA